MIEFTDDELMAIYTVLYNEVHYGYDQVLYVNGPRVVALRLALAKVEDEAKRRRLW